MGRSWRILWANVKSFYFIWNDIGSCWCVSVWVMWYDIVLFLSILSIACLIFVISVFLKDFSFLLYVFVHVVFSVHMKHSEIKNPHIFIQLHTTFVCTVYIIKNWKQMFLTFEVQWLILLAIGTNYTIPVIYWFLWPSLRYWPFHAVRVDSNVERYIGEY